MANKKSLKKNKASEGTARADTQMRVIWDDSNMRSVYANVANVTGGREEIVLLFGMNPVMHAAQAEAKIQLTDRITMSPVAAKRLSILLNNALRDYQQRYKSLPFKPRKQETPTIQTRHFSESEKTDQRVNLLFDLINDLNTNYIFERSFKMSEKTLLGNRFLFGILKKGIKQSPDDKLLEICQRINIPENYLETFRQHLPDVDYILFGFEENKNTCIYKAYLEFSAKLAEMAKINPDLIGSKLSNSEPILMFLGFKWDALDNTRRVISEYTNHPSLSFEKILKRISNIFETDQHQKPFGLATDFLDIVSTRTTHVEVNYFEVTEENSKRKSFDINIYQADIQLEELYPLLLKMCRHYSIPPGEFQALYDPFKSKIVGHLSGGIGRDGKDFLTIYFGGKDKVL